MGDLISRKALMSRIESEYMQWGEDYDVEQILGDIEDFETAFDLEGVITELRKESNDVLSNIFCYEDDDHDGIYNNGFSDGLEKAIEILKSNANETNGNELKDYANKRIAESGIRAVSGHCPVFESKEHVDMYIDMCRKMAEKGRERRNV